MQTDIDRQTGGKFTGTHMALVITGFFGVIISVNLVLAYFAAHSWTGLVVKNSYVASQKFNAHVEKAEQQKALGWKSEFSASTDKFVFTLSDSKGSAVSGLTVGAKIGRPSHEGEDFSATFRHVGNGVYAYDGTFAKGGWVVDVRARRGTQELYRKIYKVVLR